MLPLLSLDVVLTNLSFSLNDFDLPIERTGTCRKASEIDGRFLGVLPAIVDLMSNNLK